MQSCSWRIRKARTLSSLSQADLALRIGVQRSAVTQWERSGGTLPSVAHLIQVAVETGVNFEWLATGRGLSTSSDGALVPAVVMQDFAQSDVEHKVLNLIRRLSSKKQRIACSILELLAQ